MVLFAVYTQHNTTQHNTTQHTKHLIPEFTRMKKD